MNASNFSGNADTAQTVNPFLLSDSSTGPFEPQPNQTGVGSSWENNVIDYLVEQSVATEKNTDSRTSQLLDQSSLADPTLLDELLKSIPDANTTDLLGGGFEQSDFQVVQTSLAIAAPDYPGYLLRYTPGLPLEGRPAVRQWQIQMQQRGWRIAVDGFYGPESQRIARQFQQEKGLSVDGIVGEQTWRATFDNSAITGTAEPAPEPVVSVGQTPYPGTAISYRPFVPLTFDPQAQKVQQRLRSLGWQLEADGLFGSRSAIATQRFQSQNNLAPDGIIGPLTWAAIFDSGAPQAPAEQDLNPIAATNRINAAGLELIKSFEGLRLNSYQDAVGVWTIGYGHTRTAGPGQRISLAQATSLLRNDVATFEKAVSQAVRVPITENQFAALVSFAYNVGSGALNSSTLLRRLNAGDTLGAADEFLRWNRAGGRVLAGLTRRRVEERALFLS